MKDGFVLYKGNYTYLVTYSGRSISFYTLNTPYRNKWFDRTIDESIALRIQNYLIVKRIENIPFGLANYFADRGYRVTNAFKDIEEVARELGFTID